MTNATTQTKTDAADDGVRAVAVRERVPDSNGAVAARQPVDSSAALIAMIDRMVKDTSIDPERVERFFAMYERAQSQSAKMAYLTALAEMQPELPVINKAGSIDRKAKDESGTKQSAKPTKYAKWEDVVEQISQVLAKHGFSLSFRVAQPTPDRVVVTAVLGHAAGHSEDTSISLPMDATGAKNNVQGWGSSVSYGKRYTAFALLNIVARGEDDDGVAAGSVAPSPVTEQELSEFRKALAAKRVAEGAVCEMYSVESLEDLTRKQFSDAVKRLEKAKARPQ